MDHILARIAHERNENDRNMRARIAHELKLLDERQVDDIGPTPTVAGVTQELPPSEEGRLPDSEDEEGSDEDDDESEQDEDDGSSDSGDSHDSERAMTNRVFFC